MSEDYIHVRARIHLLSTAEGGREQPFTGSFRPNHDFSDMDDSRRTLGQIDLPEGRTLRPGESIEVLLALWNGPGLEGQIHPGREWRIQEGPKLIGFGTVLEILPDP